MFDPFSIGAMLLGAFIQNQSASDNNRANERAQQEADARRQQESQLAQQRQAQMRAEATKAVLNRSQEFEAKNRNDKQAEIAQTIEGEAKQAVAGPAITAQGVTIGAGLGPQSADYTATQGREQARVTDSLHKLASLMGRTGSAGQLRQQEAVGIGDTAGELGRIQNGANNLDQIDRSAIEFAGQPRAASPSIGKMLLGQALGGYGKAGLATSGLGAKPSISTGLGDQMWN